MSTQELPINNIVIGLFIAIIVYYFLFNSSSKAKKNESNSVNSDFKDKELIKPVKKYLGDITK